MQEREKISWEFQFLKKVDAPEFSGESSFPRYQEIPNTVPTERVVRTLCHKFAHVDTLYQTALTRFSCYQTSPTENALYQYGFALDGLILFMRNILDTLVQLTFLLTNHEDLLRDPHIKFNEIGKFLNLPALETDIQRVLVGDGDHYLRDPNYVRIVREMISNNGKVAEMTIEANHARGFLDVINSLSNSFKHSFIHDGLFGESVNRLEPRVTSCFVKFNAFYEPHIYHDHHLKDLYLGFRSEVARILENQRRYAVLSCSDAGQHER